MIARTASVLHQTARSQDIVARLGGDEFGILCVECDYGGGEELHLRVKTALKDAKINASTGLAMRNPSLGLKGAWETADQQMYTDKRSR